MKAITWSLVVLVRILNIIDREQGCLIMTNITWRSVHRERQCVAV